MKKVKSNTVVMRLRNSNLRRVVAGIPITAIIAVLLSFGASAHADEADGGVHDAASGSSGVPYAAEYKCFEKRSGLPEDEDRVLGEGRISRMSYDECNEALRHEEKDCASTYNANYFETTGCN
jgi:hypothetical protein